MKYSFKFAVLLAATLIAACTANGGDGGVGGVGVPGDGDGGGGDDCLLRVAGICVTGGPNTDLPNFRCTHVPGPGSTLSVAEAGPLCTLTDPLSPVLNTCDVVDAPLVLDRNFDSPGRVQYALGAVDPLLEGSVTLTVDLPGTVDAGRVAAWLVQYPGGTVDVSLLRSLTVTTTLSGTEQESAFYDTLLDLDVLGLIGASSKILVGFPNTLPYDSLSLRVDALAASADVTNAVDVFEACVAAEPI